MSNNEQSLAQVVSNINEAKKQVQEFAKTHGKAAIGKAFAPLFEQFPKLKAVEWSQFTPYFNDGEPCTFGVHEPYYFAVDAAEQGDWLASRSPYIEEQDAKYGEGFTKAAKELWAAIENEELLEAVFGDGVKITVRRDEIEVSDYDHD